MSVIVVEDIMGLGIFSDENGIKNPQDLLDNIIDCYNKEISENLT